VTSLTSAMVNTQNVCPNNIVFSVSDCGRRVCGAWTNWASLASDSYARILTVSAADRHTHRGVLDGLGSCSLSKSTAVCCASSWPPQWLAGAPYPPSSHEAMSRERRREGASSTNSRLYHAGQKVQLRQQHWPTRPCIDDLLCLSR